MCAQPNRNNLFSETGESVFRWVVPNRSNLLRDCPKTLQTNVVGPRSIMIGYMVLSCWTLFGREFLLSWSAIKRRNQYSFRYIWVDYFDYYGVEIKTRKSKLVTENIFEFCVTACSETHPTPTELCFTKWWLCGEILLMQIL